MKLSLSLLKQVLPVMFLGGCSFWQAPSYQIDAPSVGSRIKTLPEAQIPAREISAVSVAELIDQLENLEDDGTQLAVSKRLAQLRLRLMEEQLETGDTDYGQPIAALRSLKELATEPEERAGIDYQLARVLAMSGGQSDVVVAALTDTITADDSEASVMEARFRRAEIFFSNGDFAAAEADFASVAATSSEFNLHAKYMLAWVRFKLSDLEGALKASTSALAVLQDNEQRKYRELKEDVLRVAVLALDYTEGPLTLADLMRADKPEYQTDLYRALGDWYLSKDRFADSALTWQTFLGENPLHKAAPDIALEVISTQREAGFVADIPELEAKFIERYGKQTEFFAVNGEAVFEQYQKPLRAMLDRFTQRQHASAQDNGQPSGYLEAARAYEIWLTNFPKVEAAQEKRFLYAETLELARGFLVAKAQYEQVLMMNPATDFAREAAYALVLGVDQAVATLGIDAVIAVNLQFAQMFSDDPRARLSQLSAAKHLFEQADYGAASEAARLSLDMQLEPEASLVAKRLIAHSEFELGRFDQAEAVYLELRDLGEAVEEQILASVFKQGELAETDGELEEAIFHFDRLRQLAPGSALARDAMYDVAGLYEQLGDSANAIAQLEAYRRAYPKAAAPGSGIALRLIALKESQDDLLGAAEELVAFSGRTEGEAARVARFRAAELYLQEGVLPLAIEHFRFYAHNFPEPAAVRLEAMNHMDELYQQTGEPTKRHFWLRKKRDLYQELTPEDRTERATYLAANAMFELSEADYRAFQDTKLSAPLQRSLRKKQTLLQRSLDNYQAVIELQVFDYSTRSYFRMASHFEAMASELLGAEPPAGLNELEQEQYIILMEEQAFPFEEKAIALHEKNLTLGWQVGWNAAIDQSLAALQTLSPARFQRRLSEVAYVSAAD